MSRHRPAGLREDEGGVSAVLGAILIFGLLVVTLVTVQVKFVPVWDRDREAAHMAEVQSQFAQLKSDADRQADNRTSVPITDPVTLGAAAGFRFFSGPSLPGALGFAPSAAGTGFRVTSPQVHIQEQGGRRVFAGSETWQQVASGGSIPSVQAIDHLRLRIPVPHTWATGDSVTLQVTDADGLFAGKFDLHNIDHGSTYSYEYQTFAATSPTVPVTIVQDNFDKQNPPDYQYIDLLRSEFLFEDVLNQVKAPFTIALTRNVMNADYAASYVIQTPGGGTTTVGGGGRLVPNFSQTLGGGAVSFVQPNNQYPSQTYILEHGAIIVVQQDGAAMQVPPQFAVQVGGGEVDMDWVVPALGGSAATVAGPTAAAVTLEPTAGRVDFVATGPSFAFTITTLYGSLWTQHWATVMQAAGLTSSGANPQFTVAYTATTATLTVNGISPAATVDDVVLTFKGATILASVEAAGGLP